MKLLKTPNQWSCLPVAFAMALDIDIKDILKEIGHEGNKVVFKGPAPWRSFHLAECYRVALRHSYACTRLPLTAISSPDRSQKFRIPNYHVWITEMLATSKGVLLGKGRFQNHAVAWDGTNIYDPAGGIYGLHSSYFKPMEYIRFDLISLPKIKSK